MSDASDSAMTAVSDETGRGRKRDAYIGVLASLAAAISLLERTPRSKKAAASDKMFDEMVADYKKALDEGRAALSAAPVGGPLRRIVLDTLNAVAPAVENLSVHQEQCDRDGVMVKVSRQALDEVLNAVNEVAMQSAITASPDAPVAQEPVASDDALLAVCRTLKPRIFARGLLPLDGDGPVTRATIENTKHEARKILEALKPYTSPPATPAGLGADEIARASNWKLVDGTMTTGESVIFDGSFIVAKVTRRQDAELILSLLSGQGGGPTKSHAEGGE